MSSRARRDSARLTASPVMHERDATLPNARNDLVAEHGSRWCASELLDVGAAEPTCEHLDRRRGLRQLCEARPAVRI